MGSGTKPCRPTWEREPDLDVPQHAVIGSGSMLLVKPTTPNNTGEHRTARIKDRGQLDRGRGVDSTARGRPFNGLLYSVSVARTWSVTELR